MFSKNRKSRLRGLILVPALLGLSAAATPAVASTAEFADQQQQVDAPLSVVVDADVQPSAPELAPVDDTSSARPLAALTDRYGHKANFVADELIVETDDQAALSELIRRWRGRLLDTIRPADYGVDGVTARHVIRIDPRLADPAGLVPDLSELDGQLRGEHAVSSVEGLRLLAAAAHESVNGVAIDVNWVLDDADFGIRVSTEGPARGNAYTWSQLCHRTVANCVQDSGVAETWTMLLARGVMPQATQNLAIGARIPIAIVDRGFAAADADMAPGGGPVPTTTTGAFPTGCGGVCPFHGANVTSAATAVPDNDFGSAGTGGPVARPVQIFRGSTLSDAEAAITTEAVPRARIINMSFGSEIPAVGAIFTGGFDRFTDGLRRSGILLFASAGNAGRDVDLLHCFAACWEASAFLPCEATGVACVGGLAPNAMSAHPGSNFGSGGQSPEKSIDLWAPFIVEVGPDPGNSGNPHLVAGTSFASPFAAGVAALIWAAAPTLTATQVEAMLLNESFPHRVSGQQGPAVWAWRAVKAALGNVAPVARAGPDQTVDELTQVTLDGGASNDPDGAVLSFTWTQVGGPAVNLSNADTAAPSFAAPAVSGQEALAFALTVSNGLHSATDQVTMSVRDLYVPRTRPVVTVPADIVETTYDAVGKIVTFAASASDAEDGSVPVNCSPPSGSVFGHGVTAVTCTATDSHGDSGSAAFNVYVSEPDPAVCEAHPLRCGEPPK